MVYLFEISLTKSEKPSHFKVSQPLIYNILCKMYDINRTVMTYYLIQTPVACGLTLTFKLQCHGTLDLVEWNFRMAVEF